jgi:MFS family permease
VIVNTVVLVQGSFGLTQKSTAIALAAYGGGSMVMAFALPRVLERINVRRAMLAGGAVLTAGLFVGTQVNGYFGLLPLWALLGMAYSATQAPTGLLLKRSSQPEDRPALFAAQFALSHACWLIAYPLAGWSVGRAGSAAGFAALGALALVALIAARWLWPPQDPVELEHEHTNLDQGDPHLAGAERETASWKHRHPYVIDAYHSEWPRAR